MSALTELAARTYTRDGKEYRAWSLAPPFPVHWAVPKVPGCTRHFVWLTDGERFVHAVVSPQSPLVLMINREDRVRMMQRKAVHDSPHHERLLALAEAYA